MELNNYIPENNLYSSWDPRKEVDNNISSFLESLAKDFSISIKEGIIKFDDSVFYDISSFKKARSQKKLKEIFKLCKKTKVDKYVTEKSKLRDKINTALNRKCTDYYIYHITENFVFILGKKEKNENKANYKKLSIPIVQFCNYVKVEKVNPRINLQKLNESLKANSEFKWKSVVDNNTFGIVEVKYGKLLYANEAFSALTGYSNSEISKMTIADLIHPDYGQETVEMSKKILGREVDKISFQGKLIKKDKNIVHFNSSLQGVFSPEGEYVNSVFTLYDITEEIESKRKLSHTKIKYKSLIETSPSGIVQLDLKGEIIFSSVVSVEIFGYEKGEFDKKKASDYIHKEDITLFEKDLKQLLKSGKEIQAQYRAIHKTGEIFILEGKMKILKDQENNPKGILLVFNDVTERVKAKHELIKKQSTLQAILNSTKRKIISYDTNLNIININKSAIKNHKLLLNKNIKVGQNIRNIYPPEKLEYNIKNYYSKALKGETVTHEIDTTIRGHKYTLIISFEPIIDSQNNIIGFIESASDITAERKAERELINREATLKAVLDSTPNGIYAINKNMDIIAINKQAIKDFKAYGIKLKIGDSLHDLIDRDTLNQWRKLYFNKVFEGDTVHYSGVMKERHDAYVENTYSPVMNEMGEIIGCLEVSIDITEKKFKEQALTESEKRYKMLVETSPSAILQIDKEGNILFSNKRVEEIHKKKDNEIYHSNLSNITSKGFTSSLLKTLQKNKKSTEDYFLKTQISNPEGELLFIEGFWNEIIDEYGKLDGALLAYNDVTEKIIAEKELQKTQTYYEKMYENMFDPIFIYNYKENKLIDCNQAALEKLKYTSKQELLGSNAHDLVPDQSTFVTDQNIYVFHEKNKSSILKGKKIKTTGVFQTKNGEHIYCKVNILPTFQNESEAFLIMHDITEEELNRKAVIIANEKVTEKTAIYEAIIQNSSDGIDVIQFDNIESNKLQNPKLIVRNSIMEGMSGDEEKSLITKKEIYPVLNPSTNIFHGNNQESIDKNLEHFFRNGDLNIEISLKQKGAPNISIESSHKIFKIEDKNFIVRNYRDITKRLEQEKIINDQLTVLNKKNEELEKYIDSNLQLENFAYIASHDLKAPLRSVSSFAHLLKDKVYSKLEDKEKSFLDIILSSSHNMQLLIDDLLDFSRVNTWKLKMKPLNIEQLINRLKRELISDINDSGAQIVIKEMPSEIMGDTTLLMQLFQNLIKNAIKFQKPNGIPKITIEGKEINNYLSITVSDNGIGIRKEHQEKIFGIFEKLYSPEQYEGTGLGLTICKKIVERLGGTINVESELGKGSSFIISLPLQV
jgi:PAS domain S-box-containing protein